MIAAIYARKSTDQAGAGDKSGLRLLSLQRSPRGTYST
jgi:hypothetical protein